VGFLSKCTVQYNFYQIPSSDAFCTDSYLIACYDSNRNSYQSCLHIESEGKNELDVSSMDSCTDKRLNSEWEKIYENQFNNLSNHHDIMAQFYVDEYAKAMWNATGQQGNWENYRYWAYHGLNVTQAQQEGSRVITQQKYDEYEALWNNIKDDIQLKDRKSTRL